MQRLHSILALTACTLLCANAQAGNIATGATVLHVSSTNGNATSFQMMISGGTGVCTSVSGTWVVFPLSSAADADALARAYAAAMMALATGMRVTLYNYANDNCVGASYVDVYN